jgi:hypothetical protein
MGLNELLDRLLDVPKHHEVQSAVAKINPPDDIPF